MKKRILAALVMSALVLSMAGCGGNKQTPAANESDSEISESILTDGGSTTSAPDPVSQSAEDTAAASAPEAETPAESKHITASYVNLSNGFLTFIQDDTGYIYNIAEKKMYEYDQNLGINPQVKGKIACFTENHNIIYNIETKEIIVNSDDNNDTVVITGYTSDFNWKNAKYIPVMRMTKNVSGNTVVIGFLDENGEWVQPLSADSALNQTEWVKNLSFLSANIFMSEGLLSAGDLAFIRRIGDNDVYDYYNVKTDQILDENYWNDIYSKSGRDTLIAASGDKMLMANLTGWGEHISDFVLYDSKTGQVTPFDSDYNYSPDISGVKKRNFYCFFAESGDHILVFDNDFNKFDFNIDFNTYKPEKISNITEDYVLFYSNGFLCVLKKDGTAVFDPFEPENIAYATIIDDYLVCYGSYSDNISMTIDLRTGEKKTYDNGYIVGVDADSGMLLINKDGGYYLAAPSDPETLINPFA